MDTSAPVGFVDVLHRSAERYQTTTTTAYWGRDFTLEGQSSDKTNLDDIWMSDASEEGKKGS